MEALLEKDRRHANLKNSVDASAESAVIQRSIDYSAHGVGSHLQRAVQARRVHLCERGTQRLASPAAGLLHGPVAGLALEDRFAGESIILTEAQVAVLEETKHDDEAAGEIETWVYW